MNYLRLFLLFVLNVPIAFAGTDASWPCFHGPQRNNISTETGLMQTWPDVGPQLLWTNSEIGHGYSAVSIANNRIFTAGMIDKQTYVTALDMSGKKLWQELNGQSWEASEQQTWAVPYSGSRGTPTVDGDTVYHLSDLGRLTAFNINDGKHQWYIDLLESFEAEPPEYGYSESVLIHEDVLLCCPAGAKGYMAAMDKKTGKTHWISPEIKEPAGNCSSVIGHIGDIEQVVTLSASSVLSFDLNNGNLLWRYPFENSRENNIADAIVSNGLVYASSGYGKGSILLRPQLQADGKFSVEPIWTSELLDNHHGGVILHDGYLYGSGQEARGWFCLEFMTGKQMWQTDGKGSLTFADSRIYLFNERGVVSLIQPTSEKYQEVGTLTVERGGDGLFWAHPVVCGGRLYIRHSEKLYAYDISAK